MPYFNLGKSGNQGLFLQSALVSGSSSKVCQGNVLSTSLIIRVQTLVFQHRQLATCPLTRLRSLACTECYRHITSVTFLKRIVGLKCGFTNMRNRRSKQETASKESVVSTSVEQDHSYSKDEPRLP